jgi:hypothetical protein
MPRTKPVYPPEFNAEAVRLVGVPRPIPDPHRQGPWSRRSNASELGATGFRLVVVHATPSPRMNARNFINCAARCARRAKSGNSARKAATGFATLGCELLACGRFTPRRAARLALIDDIEGFSNTHRRHSALGYLSPAAYERRWSAQRVVS